MSLIRDSPTNETLRVAVVSDLHAYATLEQGEVAPSNLCTVAPEDQPTQHPIMALLELIDKAPLTADLLVCCGDMGDKAKRAGIRYVWEKLQIIKKRLKAKHLYVTSGNHDVDSRHVDDYDAKGYLQSLVPQYPFTKDEITDRYWARNYVILTEPKYRMVVLNSSAYHGTTPEEYEHGRITPRTLEALRRELEDLEAMNPRDVNILICHHHPHKHDDVEDSDYSTMLGGEKLLKVLGSGKCGDWIVIHGHKHHPRLCYAAGGSSAPVIFGAGSLSAIIYPELQQIARNQFHLIEFPMSIARTLGLGLIGTFETWDWVKGIGWLPASRRSGLPPVGGFGNRDNKLGIAVAVENAVRARGESFVEWSEVQADVPGLKYLIPIDLEWVVQKLQTKMKMQILADPDDGRIEQIGFSRGRK
jgi:predicted MPP superfamily phosphohydrolase